VQALIERIYATPADVVEMLRKAAAIK